MKKKSNAGRPTVITEAVVLKLEQAFAIDCSVEEACSYADIGRNAFYDYLKKNPEYSNRIAQLRERPVLAARQRVVKGVNESYQNAMDYLKRKKKLEFSERQEVTGADGTPLMVQISEVIAKKNAIMKSDTHTQPE